jgi:4-diphosphocytidyl-2-C-methyl-D-erythritol kinase
MGSLPTGLPGPRKILRAIHHSISVYCDRADVPLNSSNTAYKAAKLVMEEYNINQGVSIFIDKHIPVGAGLAGGSTDAAGVIKGMNRLFELNMTHQKMMEIALKVGADVPFCIIEGTALAEGIGEILTPVKPLKDIWVVIAKPSVGVSTREVFAQLKTDEIPRHPDIQRLIEYINRNDIRSLAHNMVNVLETVTIKKHPIIFEIKNIMMEFDSLGSLMTGSGSAVFGLFEDKNAAEKCFNRLRDYLKEVFMVKTCGEEVRQW